MSEFILFNIEGLSVKGLTGCSKDSQNKVTADYLVGKWECTVADIKIANKEDNEEYNEEYLELLAGSIGKKYVLTFSKTDKSLSMATFADGKLTDTRVLPIKGEVIYGYEDEDEEYESEKYKHSLSSEFIYLSNNKYNHIINQTFFYKGEVELKVKTKRTCTRINSQ